MTTAGTHITQEQADEYAIGSLEPEIAELIAAHGEECSACGGLLAASERAATSLMLGLRVQRPSRKLRKKVLRSTGVVRPSPLRWVVRVATAGAGAAAVFVAIAAFTGMISVKGQINDLRKENVNLQEQIHDALSQKIEIAALTQRLSEEERTSSELRSATRSDRDLLLAIMSPDSDTAEVFGVNDYASAVGRLVWDEQQRRLWFIASRLPALPEGQTYQIWVSSGGRYVSLGTFNSDASGFARYETLVPQGLKSYESAVVTIERAGGAPERSGQSAFVTDLSRLRR